MRSELTKLAACLAAILAGLGIATLAREGWLINVAIGVLLAGIVFLGFAIRDVICALLRRAGRQPDPDKVFVHLCAAVMLLIALAIFFDNDPRLGGLRWVLLVLLPGMLYALAFVFDWMSGRK